MRNHPPIKNARTSFLGNYHMLDLVRLDGARLLLASTSEVVDDPEDHPQPESYHGCVVTIGIRSCCNVGKRVAEILRLIYQRMHGTEIRLVRIFNTYVPRMLPDDGLVVSNSSCRLFAVSSSSLYGGRAH